MRAMISVVIMSVLIWVAGCSSTRVWVNYDENTDFTGYSTYHFVRPKPDNKPLRQKNIQNPYVNRELIQEIRPVMKEKGFEEVTSIEDADLLVHFYAFIKSQSHYQPASYRVGRFGRIWRTRPGHVVNVKEGTLVIDIVDAEKKELVWQGVGKDLLNPRNPAEHLLEAVEQVLSEFPPN